VVPEAEAEAPVEVEEVRVAIVPSTAMVGAAQAAPVEAVAPEAQVKEYWLGLM
jgi:hypothetical protein